MGQKLNKVTANWEMERLELLLVYGSDLIIYKSYYIILNFIVHLKMTIRQSFWITGLVMLCLFTFAHLGQ